MHENMREEEGLASVQQQQEALASTFFRELMKDVESFKGHTAYLNTEQRNELKRNLDELQKELED